MSDITKEMLRSFLHDALPEAESATVEKALRDDPALQKRYEEVRQEEDRGEHSLGALWRRENLTCPNRGQLDGYIQQAIDPEFMVYIQFHLLTMGCPYCLANLEDLEKAQAEAPEQTKTRRRKIVNSSADLLRDVTGS